MLGLALGFVSGPSFSFFFFFFGVLHAGLACRSLASSIVLPASRVFHHDCSHCHLCTRVMFASPRFMPTVLGVACSL